MTLKIWSIQLCITVGNVTEVLGFLPSLYGSLNERISTVNPHMRKRIALCHGTQQDNFHGIAKLVKIRLLVHGSHLPYSILKSAVTVYLDMTFSPLKNFASKVFFFLRFRTNIFPFPLDIFSEKQKFCSSFICKLGGPFIKLSTFISILYKKFILISLFQSFNSVFA